jgi:hypothetical protein
VTAVVPPADRGKPAQKNPPRRARWPRVATIAIGVICLGLAADFSSGQAVKPSPIVPRTQGGGKGGISPVVVAEWFTHRVGGVEQLELLILWRGTPGWFLQPGTYADSGGEPGGHNTWMKLGSIEVSMAFDDASRRIRIQGKEAIALGKDNVLFVDDVDGPSGPRVVGSMSVARAMPGSAGQIAPIVKSSPRIMAFLRCDAGDDSPRRERLRMMCLTNIGVER